MIATDTDQVTFEDRLRDPEFRRKYRKSIDQRDEILAEIKEERRRQDSQWGGPDHDDQHECEDWIAFIDRQLTQCSSSSPETCRERLVKIAALAIAGIAAMDRRAQSGRD